MVRLIDILRNVRDFIDNLSNLAFGRDIPFYRKVGFADANINLRSAARTLESIRYCCKNANFADAYTLLRKYRDDLFYYLYLLSVSDNSDITEYVDVGHLKKEEKDIWDWAHNQQENLYISEVLKYIAFHSAAKEAVHEFGLKELFDELADKLNDYVHSNGYKFYNRPYQMLNSHREVRNLCNDFCNSTLTITITFLFLTILIRPLVVMSTDYTDYLEVGDIPPDNSEYWVAPFVSDFLTKYKDLLDEKCIIYLRKQTKMEI